MFEMFKDKSKLWRFRVKALNNKIIAVSESYSSRQNCIKGMKSLINNVSESTPIKDVEKDEFLSYKEDLSERLEKVDQELGYPDIKIDRNKLNDIWNTIVE